MGLIAAMIVVLNVNIDVNLLAENENACVCEVGMRKKSSGWNDSFIRYLTSRASLRVTLGEYPQQVLLLTLLTRRVSNFFITLLLHTT